MTKKDRLFWKKDDMGITRAPFPLNDEQKIRAEDTLDAAREKIQAALHKNKKSG
jgi:hypothetical protein